MFRALGDAQQPVLGLLERALSSHKPRPLPVTYPERMIAACCEIILVTKS